MGAVNDVLGKGGQNPLSLEEVNEYERTGESA